MCERVRIRSVAKRCFAIPNSSDTNWNRTEGRMGNKRVHTSHLCHAVSVGMKDRRISRKDDDVQCALKRDELCMKQVFF